MGLFVAIALVQNIENIFEGIEIKMLWYWKQLQLQNVNVFYVTIEMDFFKEDFNIAFAKDFFMYKLYTHTYMNGENNE